MAQVGRVRESPPVLVEVRRIGVGVDEQVAAVAFEPGVAQARLESRQSLGRPQQPSPYRQTVDRVFRLVQGHIVREAVAVPLFSRQAERQLVRDKRPASGDRQCGFVRRGDGGAGAKVPVEGRVHGPHHHGAGQGVQTLQRRLRSAEDLHLTHVPDVGRTVERDGGGQGRAIDIDGRQGRVAAARHAVVVDAPNREAVVAVGLGHVGGALEDFGQRLDGFLVDPARGDDADAGRGVLQRAIRLFAGDDDLIQRRRLIDRLRPGPKRAQSQNGDGRRGQKVKSRHGIPRSLSSCGGP